GEFRPPDDELRHLGPLSERGVALVVFAGKEYGSGSSRDWAAKGPNLMGVRAAIAESFERIHRSNLVMMGIIPLEFMPGETMASLGLTGQETFTIRGLDKLARGEADRRGDVTGWKKEIVAGSGAR